MTSTTESSESKKMQFAQGEGDAPSPNQDNQMQPTDKGEKSNEQNGDHEEGSKQQGKEIVQEDKNKASSSTCNPVATYRL